MNTKSSALKEHGCKEVNGNLAEGTICILRAVAAAPKGTAHIGDCDSQMGLSEMHCSYGMCCAAGRKKMTFIKSH